MTELLLLNEEYCISIWSCPRGYAKFVVDAYQKVDRGVKHLVQRYSSQRFPIEGVLELAKIDLQQGYFSPRPYQLGQACDGSIAACVMALFKQFCDVHSVDPIALYREAYREHDGDKYFDPDFEAELRFAEWEGVAYPHLWNEPAIAGLVDSLTEINNHQLASLVEERFLSNSYHTCSC